MPTEARGLGVQTASPRAANCPISKLLHALGGHGSSLHVCMTHGICVRRASPFLLPTTSAGPETLPSIDKAPSASH